MVFFIQALLQLIAAKKAIFGDAKNQQPGRGGNENDAFERLRALGELGLDSAANRFGLDGKPITDLADFLDPKLSVRRQAVERLEKLMAQVQQRQQQQSRNRLQPGTTFTTQPPAGPFGP